jgi:glycosyltransferase involved in cell wall biosynthesis
MSANGLPLNARSNTQVRRETLSRIFGNQPALQRIPSRSQPVRIAVVGNHLPRQCGIATFTTDLCDAITTEFGAAQVFVAAVNDSQRGYNYPARVRLQIAQDDLPSYRTAAAFLNSSAINLVSLQHEFGIYGGDAGSHVLELLRHLTKPVVTTLHTVLREPDTAQRAVMQELIGRSNRLVVMSGHSSLLLQQVFGVSSEKIDMIPHGIPDLPFADPDVNKGMFSISNKTVMLTFGLLSPNKGFESVIQALPDILSRHSEVVYVIAGATHPHVRLREGDRYRIQLEALARALGVDKNVIFHNRFFTPQEMALLVGAADIYITPYCHEAQAVSGTLAFALGAGKAIISTPYWHAAELLGDGRGMLVPFGNPGAIAATAIHLLENEAVRQEMRQRAYLHGRDMVWNRVAQSYMQTFRRASIGRMLPARAGFSYHADEQKASRTLASA